MEKLALAMTQDYPDYALGWQALGVALKQMDRTADALPPMQKSTQLMPNDAEAHGNLGVMLRDLGRLSEAEACYRRAIALKPDFAEAHYNLGEALFNNGRFAESEISYRQAINLKPDYAEAHYNLGNALRDLERLSEAEASYRQTITIKSDYVEAHVNLGNLLKDIGRLSEAEACYRQVIALKPDHAEAYSNLGVALRDLGRISEAETSYRQAIAIKPDFFEAYSNLGVTLTDLGRPAEAEASYRQAIILKPDYDGVYSDLLFTLNYDPDKTADEIFSFYQTFDETFCLKYRKDWQGHANTREPHRRLKIGYVSPDFRMHSARHFIAPLLARHDRRRVEVYAYAEIKIEDFVTEQLKGYVDHWRRTVGLSDEVLSEQIRKDGIDILVDLAGHTSGNRLKMFGHYKPAPVTVSWLGYGYTTGLSAMDYFLTDEQTVPEGSEAFFAEIPWRLPSISCAFRPAEGMGDVNALPALNRGYVTFGSLTRSVRLNHRTIRVWSELLKALPDSRLVINSRDFRDATFNARLLEKFREHEIDAERLQIGFESPPWDVLRGIDISLDCFPHNSGTTLFESLYMGVPFITLADRPSVGRLGSSILSGLGRQEWIGKTENEYLDKAFGLASNLANLSLIRQSLRREMEQSLLMDEAGFAYRVEDAYQSMWRKYCQ